jgi:hypothetical protein
MNKTASIGLLFLYLTALLVPLYPVADYLLHEEYIAKTFCENKDKPMLHCNGKCHLMKQLKKAAEQNHHKDPTRIASENFLPHFPASGVVSISVYSIPVKPAAPHGQFCPAYSLIFSVFHPPQC